MNLFTIINTVSNLEPVSLYIDPTAITTSLVSASGIIIALGASAGVIVGRLATISANMSVFVSKITRGFINVFGVVDNGGKTVEPEIKIKKK